MPEDVVVLDAGDERARKIAKTMSSGTACDILSLLKEGELTLTDISEKLGQPLTSLKYHVENLLDTGLIEVKRIKYSEKGREVKVYGATGKIVVVAPGVTNVRDILLKYASIFGIFVLAAAAIAACASVFAGSGVFDSEVITDYAGGDAAAEKFDSLRMTFADTGAGDNAAYVNDSDKTVLSVPELESAAANASPAYTAVMKDCMYSVSGMSGNAGGAGLSMTAMLIAGFIFGGIFVIAVMCACELYRSRRNGRV